jgi:hypothetical protein
MGMGGRGGRPYKKAKSGGTPHVGFWLSLWTPEAPNREARAGGAVPRVSARSARQKKQAGRRTADGGAGRGVRVGFLTLASLVCDGPG